MRRNWTGGAALAVAFTMAACGGGGGERPAPRTEPAVSVTPASGAPGDDVTVRARGFAADNTVVIGFGRPESEYEVIRQARTDAEGAVAETVPVPRWADSGRDYVWVVADRDNEPRVVSDPFAVR